METKNECRNCKYYEEPILPEYNGKCNVELPSWIIASLQELIEEVNGIQYADGYGPFVSTINNEVIPSDHCDLWRLNV